MSSWKQRQRQEHRGEAGRYAAFNPCYRCGKSAGADYCSGPYVDRADATGRQWNDEMLCLCEACAQYLAKLHAAGQVLAIHAEVDGGQWGQLPQGKEGEAWTVELRRGPLPTQLWEEPTAERAKKRAWALVELHAARCTVVGRTIIVDAERWYAK